MLILKLILAGGAGRAAPVTGAGEPGSMLQQFDNTICNAYILTIRYATYGLFYLVHWPVIAETLNVRWHAQFGFLDRYSLTLPRQARRLRAAELGRRAQGAGARRQAKKRRPASMRIYMARPKVGHPLSTLSHALTLGPAHCHSGHTASKKQAGSLKQNKQTLHFRVSLASSTLSGVVFVGRRRYGSCVSPT